MMFRLLENTFASQKLNQDIITHPPRQKSPQSFYHHPKVEENHSSHQSLFLRIYFPPAERAGGLWKFSENLFYISDFLFSAGIESEN